MKLQINTKTMKNKIAWMEKVALKLTKETILVRNLFILNNIEVLQFQELPTLQVSYAENLKQTIKKSKICKSFDSQVVPECDLTQSDRSLLETSQLLGDPFEYEILCPKDRRTGSFVTNHVFNQSKKELADNEIFAIEKCLGFAPTPLSH